MLTKEKDTGRMTCPLMRVDNGQFQTTCSFSTPSFTVTGQSGNDPIMLNIPPLFMSIPVMQASSSGSTSCRGKMCMMWRWSTDPTAEEDPGEALGYCGMAGEPWASK